MTRGRLIFLLSNIFLIVGFFIFSPNLWAAEKDVQITEIMYNPNGPDAKNEWLEIKNLGETPVEIRGGAGETAWRLFDGANHTFSTSTSLQAGQYCAVTQDEETFLSTHPNFLGPIIKSAFTLTNTSGTVALRLGSDGELWSKVDYDQSWGGNDNGYSLEKKEEIGSNTFDNWQQSFVWGGTVGAHNSFMVPVTSSTEDIVVTSTPTSTLDFMAIKFNEIYSVPATSTEKEWLELFNPTSSTVDLTGWVLLDNSSTTTLSGEILAENFLVLDFSNRLNNLGDQLILKDNQGQIVDQVRYGNFNDGNIDDNVPAPLAGQSLNRDQNNQWRLSLNPTKGLSNVIVAPVDSVSEEVFVGSSGGEVNFVPLSNYQGKIFLSEFLSDPNVGEKEWVELYNNSAEVINLNNWYLEEGSEEETRLTGEIQPHNFLLFYQPKGNLNNSGDVISLFDSFGKLLDKVAYGNWDDGNVNDNALAPYDGQSSARKDWVDINNRQNWQTTEIVTPGLANQFFTTLKTTPEVDNSTSTVVLVPVQVILNEILPNPLGNDQEGEFIEIKNLSSANVDLKGYYLINSSRKKFKFTSSTLLLAENFLVVPRSLTNLSLKNNGGETLEFYNPSNRLVDKIFYEDQALEGVSFARASSTGVVWEWSTVPTPGQNNIIARPNTPPQIIISAPSQVSIGEEIILDASDSYDIDGDKISFSWNFGDKITAEGGMVSHIYQTAGNKTVTLVIDDKKGGQVKEKIKVVVVPDEEMEKNETASTAAKIKKTKNTVSVNSALSQVAFLPLNTLVKTSGVVVVPPQLFSTQMFFIIDSDSGAGLPVYMYNKDFPDLKTGDKVEVSGELGSYLGTVRLKIKNKTDIEILSTNNNISPQVLSLSDIDEDKFFSLVKLSGEVLETGSGYFYLGDDQGEIKIQFKSKIGIKGKIVGLGDQVEVVGLIGKSKDTWVVWPRQIDDIRITKVAAATTTDESKDLAEKYLTATAGGVTSLLLALLAKSRGAMARMVGIGFLSKVAFWKKTDKDQV